MPCPPVWALLGAALLVSAAISSLQAKPIRLRNEIIDPARGHAKAAQLPAAASGQADGLFLIQFRSPPDREAREQLRRLGVQLLRYVPEDTFIVRLRSTGPGLIAGLPSVEWIGEFRPEHKVLQSLPLAAAKAKATSGRLSVAVMLAPESSDQEIAEVRHRFASIRQESRLRTGAILRGTIHPGQLESLAGSGAVLWIEPARDMKLFDEVSSKIVAGDGGLNQLYTQSLGYTGAGVKVAVADSGLNNGDAATMHPDLFGRTPAFFHYGTLTDAADEHSHGTHVAGIIAGNGATGETDDDGALYGLGVAPGADIITQRIFDDAGGYQPPPSFEKMTRDALSAGADIGSNSWGDDTQGRYDLSASEFDALVRDADALTDGDQPYILEFSAGNAGPGTQTIGSPAVAKNVIATGATENDRLDFLIYADGPDVMADFSSRGPCEDGRIKPDLTAPGTWIASLQSESATDQYAWASIDSLYQYQGGTSQAGPHVSGAAAVFVQYYRQAHTNATPSPALVKAALIHSAVPMFFVDAVPNNDEGWGRVDLTEVIGSPIPHEYLDQSVLLTNGQVYERRVLVGSSDAPLRITLAYTDEPGFPGAIPALVNDLDLEVLSPDDHLFRGNQFDNGESAPDALAADNKNNVEGIYLSTPVPGEYVVRVRGTHIVQDAVGGIGGIDQDFALVLSADIAAPGTGIITFDKQAYRAPDTLKLKLVDGDLAGRPTASVTLLSSTETNAEMIPLYASGTTGLFTGNVATATGPALPNGRLEISHGDVIQAVYHDTNPPATRVFTARADLLPPLLSGITVINRFGVAEARWTTDEPANSTVLYGPTPALGSGVTNASHTTSHATAFPDAIPGSTNYFKVICADVAGNSTNANGGALFQFVAPHAPAILVVDAYTNDVLVDPPPPIEDYTGPLNALGLTYDVWSVAGEPKPITVTNLRPYRVVLWRLPEFSFAAPTLTVSDRAALTDYLNGGGALFIASMEAATRLDETGASAFRKNQLHIADLDVDATVPDVEGVAGDIIGDGLALSLDFQTYWDWDLSDTISPGANAAGILLKSGTPAYAGLRYPRAGVTGSGRVVFLSFPLDAISQTDPPPNNRTTVLKRILSFLAPGLNGEGSISFDRPAYTIPSDLLVQVADSDLEGQAQVTVAVYTSTEPSGTLLNLGATPQPGVFLGTISLVATNSGTNPQLKVRNGDSVWAEYFDASSNRTVVAQAVVETNPPVIANLSVSPGYVDAVVSWDTSELTSASVQFGESRLLGRSAEAPDFSDYHDVVLYGLQPSRTYYFQVMSRDRAGNVTVDDNHTNLYAFTTLTPLAPPWTDNLERGDTNWSIYTPADSEEGWRLGAPDPFFADAHSPTNCWGTNLRFYFLSQSESYLISPAILLSGGNKITLDFWQSYDFSILSENDILHLGEVLLITNNALEPIVLAQYGEDLADWHKVSFDLSPYAGQIVYLAWHYFLFSLDSWIRQGWLLDDLSVTATTVAPGTIVITNNLWQAVYALGGPTPRIGAGLGTTITNAVPGQYSIDFGTVPWYHTPASQSNILASGGLLTFQGNYTITDANSNAMPDEWETRFFGNVSTNRTRSTDTDGDGMSDYAEFIAGTDPNSPAKPFQINANRLSGSACRLSWPSVPAQLYRVLHSTNLQTWAAYSPWIEATGQVSFFDVPIPAGAKPSWFRVQAGATNSPAGMPPELRLLLQRLPTGTNRFSWRSATNRAYRVEMQTNGSAWSAVSDWLTATPPTNSWNFQGPINASPALFRFEVKP